MPTDSSRHRHKERRRRSRSRSRSRSKERHSTKRNRDQFSQPIKKEKFSPVRDIKREQRSPDEHHRKGHRHEQGGHRRRREEGDWYKHDREKNDDRRMNNGRQPHDDKRKRHRDVDDSQFEYGKPGQSGVKEEPVAEEDKSKPDYELSGKLADDTNTFRGVVVKYNEPPEARKPKLKWRLYPFKGDTAMPVLHIHRQSGYLLGRDRKVADIPVDHPSCSKQHAVLQFRSVDYTRDDGTKSRRTRPYIIDLGSANGTFINNKQIESQRYVELIEKDTIKFGFSSRDYVILHDNVEVSPTGANAADAAAVD